MKYGSFLISILFLLDPVTVKAMNIQDLDSLKQAAESYARTKVDLDSNKRTEITIGNLDPRLRLTACDGDLITFTPPGSRLKGNSTVGVRCDSPKPWSIYIAVKIAIYQQVIVTTGKMTRGHMIGIDDITLDEVDISRVRGRSFTDKEGLIGTKVKTSVTSNQVIDSATICLICKGDSVVITANSNIITVSMAGIALNDGSKGDKIRVQNNASRRIIDAIITDIGVVKAGI